jgi:hypothetical protein
MCTRIFRCTRATGLLLGLLTIFSVRGFGQVGAGDTVRQNTPAGSFLIINSFDGMSMQARKNKKELFRDLADSLKSMLKMELNKRYGEIVIVPGLIANPSGGDSIYLDVLNRHSATKAIIIKDLNAYFEQTGVEVTKDQSGSKSRVASYDINADVTYVLYSDHGTTKEFRTQVFEFFTNRSVASGLLAAGPDIVGKHKHAFKIIRKNAEQFARQLSLYLTGE